MLIPFRKKYILYMIKGLVGAKPSPSQADPETSPVSVIYSVWPGVKEQATRSYRYWLNAHFTNDRPQDFN